MQSADPGRPRRMEKNGLGETVRGLNSAHSPRRVYLILAIGRKWMPFLWDPEAPLNPAGSPLFIQMANEQVLWPVDPRIHMIAPANLQGQRHIAQGQNGELIVMTRRAYILLTSGRWNKVETQQTLFDMVFLENFFALVQTTRYQGENPPDF